MNAQPASREKLIALSESTHPGHLYLAYRYTSFHKLLTIGFPQINMPFVLLRLTFSIRISACYIRHNESRLGKSFINLVTHFKSLLRYSRPYNCPYMPRHRTKICSHGSQRL